MRENVCQVIINVNCITNVYYISNYITKLYIISGFMHRQRWWRSILIQQRPQHRSYNTRIIIVVRCNFNTTTTRRRKVQTLLRHHVHYPNTLMTTTINVTDAYAEIRSTVRILHSKCVVTGRRRSILLRRNSIVAVQYFVLLLL